MSHPTWEHGHRALLLVSYRDVLFREKELKLAAVVVARVTQLDSHAQLSPRSWPRTQIDVPRIVIAHVVAGELKRFVFTVEIIFKVV